jgi:hypothetical protein
VASTVRTLPSTRDDLDAAVALWLADHDARGVRASRHPGAPHGATQARDEALVRWLLARPAVELALAWDADPAVPVWYGLACYELAPLPVLHYAALADAAHDPEAIDLAADTLRALLAPLHALRIPVALSMEIPVLHRRDLRDLGAGRRSRWYTDDLWLARHLPWSVLPSPA